MKIIITSPSLNVNTNVSGVSAVTNFIIKLNTEHEYIHFEVGKKDDANRDWKWFRRLLKMYFKWLKLMIGTSHMIHFNFPVDKRSIMRDVPLILMAKVFRKRLVIHLHGGEYLMNRNVPRLLKIMTHMALRGKHPIICLSITEKRIVTVRFKNRHAVELPNAIDTTIAETFTRAYNNGSALSILFMGRLHAEKGLQYIYPALEMLKNQGLDFKFVMAGKGPLEEEYDKKFRELLGDRYEFKGVVYGDSKVAALKESDIFILPSFWEGLPIALLEAMSFGLVPVTTDAGAMKTVVLNNTTGLIVEVKSGTSIADAITKLSADRQKMKVLSKNSRELVELAYNPYKYIERLNKIYQYE